MKFHLGITTFIWSVLASSFVFVVNAQVNITNYYDRNYEIYEPSMIHSMIDIT